MEGNLKPPKELILDGDTNWGKFKQFNLFLKASGYEKKDSEMKIAIFLNIAGEQALDVFNTLKLTEEEKKDYEKVIQCFEDYCLPRKNVIFETYKFMGRVQKEGEKFDHFLTDLRVQAKLCEFGDQEDRLIRDRIVIGINEPQLQERLLRCPELSLQQAINQCRAAEAGREQAKTLQENEAIDFIKKDTKEKYQKAAMAKKRNCGKCGKIHNRGECPAYGKECLSCHKKNHFSNVCRLRKGKQPSRNVNQLEEESASGSASANFENIFCDTVRAIEAKLESAREIEISCQSSQISPNVSKVEEKSWI